MGEAAVSLNHSSMASAKAPANASEFLTFSLGSEEYGIDILRVQEIRGYDAVTKIANSPAFIKGVINLRGAIVPIVDLRIRFDLAEVTYTEFTVVIILNVLGRTVGVVVDGVSDVIAIAQDDIKPPPEFGALIETQHLIGLGTINDKLLILIDIEKLLGDRSMQLTLDDSDV